jgi:putative transposase
MYSGTDRDVAAALVVSIGGLAAVRHTVKMFAEGKFIGVPVKQESPGFWPWGVSK